MKKFPLLIAFSLIVFAGIAHPAFANPPIKTIYVQCTEAQGLYATDVGGHVFTADYPLTVHNGDLTVFEVLGSFDPNPNPTFPPEAPVDLKVKFSPQTPCAEGTDLSAHDYFPRDTCTIKSPYMEGHPLPYYQEFTYTLTSEVAFCKHTKFVGKIRVMHEIN